MSARFSLWNLAAVTLGASLALAGFRAHAQEVTVRKRAADNNPTIAISAFTGPAPLKQRFERTLRRADWFTVAAPGGNPDYTLAVRYSPGARDTLDLQIQARGGTPVPIRRTAAAGRTDTLVFAATDALIEKVFGVPGPCAAKIAFVVTGRKGKKEIYTCNFDGTGATRLTHNGTISTEPSWGPGGKTLVYTLYQNNTTNVILMDMEHRRQRLLSRHRGLNAGAALSPDGRWAALCLSRDRRIELYLLSLGTGALRRLTNDLAVESSPCWSPDGSVLCYVSNRAGNPQLYLMPAAGGRPARLLTERDEAVSPDWSPASNRICFSTQLGRQYVVGYVDMKDPARKRVIVTRAAGDWEAPSWAPDGRHLVCSRNQNGHRALYMVDTWQKRLIPITRGGDFSLPNWQK